MSSVYFYAHQLQKGDVVSGKGTVGAVAINMDFSKVFVFWLGQGVNTPPTEYDADAMVEVEWYTGQGQ